MAKNKNSYSRIKKDKLSVLNQAVDKPEISLLENKYLKIICSVLFAIFLVYLAVFLQNRKVVGAELSLKEYRYVRETPNYKVYAVNFTINNTGNKDFTILQAIPADPNDKSETVNFLQNKNCETYTNQIIDGGKLKDFTVHVYVYKNLIEFMKLNEERFQLFIYNELNGEKQKPKDILSRFQVIVKVLIKGADNNYFGAISEPIYMNYSKGYERLDVVELKRNKLPKSVIFTKRNEFFYNCPVKNLME